ncbi:hypothetical protein Leryth_021054 [Lithospermum erythrorhizon]|nr:hypothetical protein Leryth_021054 [Lithospermum erythrorhizon]
MVDPQAKSRITNDVLSTNRSDQKKKKKESPMRGIEPESLIVVLHLRSELKSGKNKLKVGVLESFHIQVNITSFYYNEDKVMKSQAHPRRRLASGGMPLHREFEPRRAAFVEVVLEIQWLQCRRLDMARH